MSGFALGVSTVEAAAALLLAAGIAGLAAPHLLRRPRPRRVLGFAALAAALLGLLALVLRPASLRAATGGESAVLWTGDGGGDETGQSLRVSFPDGNRAFGGPDGPTAAVAPTALTTAPDLAPAPSNRRANVAVAEGSVSLPDARTLWRWAPQVRRLDIRGYGLDAWDLDGFRGAITAYAPPPLPGGVTAALWRRSLPLGASLLVQLRTAAAGRVDLIGPGGVEASADAATAQRGALLSVRPAAAGAFLYEIVAHDAAGHELAREPLDVAVEAPRPPRILALFGAPNFESRALLRFLTEAGAPFVASLELTRDRQRLESVWPAACGPPLAAAPLTAAGLARCDVLLIDGRAWHALSASERAAVAAAVEGGLGVTLFAADATQGEEAAYPLRSRPVAGAIGATGVKDATGAMDATGVKDAAGAAPHATQPSGASGSRSGATVRSPAAEEAADAGSEPASGGTGGGLAADHHEPRLSWEGQEPLPALAVPGRDIAPAPGVEPLVHDELGRWTAARSPQGAGIWSLSTVEESFPWSLGDDRAAFGAYWARLIAATARPDAAPRFLPPAGPLLIDRPVEVTLLVPAASATPAPAGRLAAANPAAPASPHAAASGAAAAPQTASAPQAASSPLAASSPPATSSLLAAPAIPSVQLLEAGGNSAPTFLPAVPAGPGRFEVRFWPRASGWLRLTASNGAATSLYVAPPAAWRTWRFAQRVAATTARVATAAAGASGTAAAGATAGSAPPATVLRPWPRWPFYLLFLVAAAALWLDERLHLAGSSRQVRSRSAAPS